MRVMVMCPWLLDAASTALVHFLSGVALWLCRWSYHRRHGMSLCRCYLSWPCKQMLHCLGPWLRLVNNRFDVVGHERATGFSAS
jgi:hypothetical protein